MVVRDGVKQIVCTLIRDYVVPQIQGAELVVSVEELGEWLDARRCQAVLLEVDVDQSRALYVVMQPSHKVLDAFTVTEVVLTNAEPLQGHVFAQTDAKEGHGGTLKLASVELKGCA